MLVNLFMFWQTPFPLVDEKNSLLQCWRQLCDQNCSFGRHIHVTVLRGTSMYQGMPIGSFIYCSILIFLEQSYFHYHTYIIIYMFWVSKLYNFAVNVHVGYSCRLSSFLCELHACVCWEKRTPVPIQVLCSIFQIILFQ